MRPPSREDVQAAQSHLVPISRSSQQIRLIQKPWNTLWYQCYRDSITMYHRSFWYCLLRFYWSPRCASAGSRRLSWSSRVPEVSEHNELAFQDCITRSRQSSFGIRVAWRFIAHLEAFDGRAEQRLVQSQQRLNSFDLLFIWILHGTVCAFVYVWCCYILMILSTMSTEASSSSTFQCLDLTVSTCFDTNDMGCNLMQACSIPTESLRGVTWVENPSLRHMCQMIEIDSDCFTNLLDFDTLWHNTSLQALLSLQICNLNDWSQSSSGSTAKCLFTIEIFSNCLTHIIPCRISMSRE